MAEGGDPAQLIVVASTSTGERQHKIRRCGIECCRPQLRILRCQCLREWVAGRGSVHGAELIGLVCRGRAIQLGGDTNGGCWCARGPAFSCGFSAQERPIKKRHFQKQVFPLVERVGNLCVERLKLPELRRKEMVRHTSRISPVPVDQSFA
jgi:hypothetical protein